jgi:hypothetical protein
VADTLTEARRLLRTRLAELQGEMKQIERALENLDGQRRGPRRTRRSRARGTAHPRAGRGRRQQAFLKAVQENPGIPTKQLAEKIGVSPNRGYGLARKLRDQKLIRKQGKGYRVTGAK